MADVEFERFKKIVKSQGYKMTPPRMRMFGYLQNHSALTLKKLISLVLQHDQVTVYRNVDLFEKLGVVTKIQIGRDIKIELSDMFRHHHHHMSCVNCDKVYVLRDNPAIEQQIARISKSSGFKPTDHSLEIRGLCQTCQTKTSLKMTPTV